ncbi:hypothetical protein [Paracoccus mutanolyticus]|uniref:hypothetical protein n=1 Tax=Paracoccus mutanolyticus TaxID=1499308 RepID=UPI0021D51FFA|nr:hypothetical protein [Paracoccus mutanolyticus]
MWRRRLSPGFAEWIEGIPSAFAIQPDFPREVWSSFTPGAPRNASLCGRFRRFPPRVVPCSAAFAAAIGLSV